MYTTDLMRTLLIVCPLVFLGGFVDAVAGGAALITLPAYLLAGLPPHMAVATNKCSSVFGTFSAMTRYAGNGSIHWRAARLGAVGALPGAWIGARLSLVVPERALYKIMLAAIPFLALFLLKNRTFGQEDRSDQLSLRALLIRSASIGFFISIYDGFLGPGAGTFFMLAYTGICRFDLLTASGTTKTANFASNVASLITFALAGKVVWMVGIPAAVCSVAGNYLGSGLAMKKGIRIIRPMFFLVLALLMVWLLRNFLGQPQ